MIYIIIDIILNTYFNIPSYTVVMLFSHDKLKNIVITGLILDIFILNSYIITLLFVIIFFINKYIFKKLNKLIINIFNLLILIAIIYLVSDIQNIIIILLINITIYTLCYITQKKEILLKWDDKIWKM